MSDAATPLGIGEVHIRRFERRAVWLKRAAYLILFVIFLLVGAAALVYILAEDIARRDVSGGDAEPTHSSLEALNITKDSLEKEIELVTKKRDAYLLQFDVGQRSLLEVLNVVSELSTLNGRHALLLLKIKEFKRTGEPVNINTVSSLEELTAARDNDQEIFKEIQKIVVVLREMVEAGAGSLAELTQAELRLQAVSGNLQLLNQKIDTFVLEKSTEAEIGAVDLTFLFQTNITRFGTLIVIFFFISILVPIYRYNIQMAAFYDAVSDAMMLTRDIVLTRDAGTGDISSLVGVLTPSVSFGKGPATPIQQGAELVKALARSRPT